MSNIAAYQEVYTANPQALSITIHAIYDRIESEGLKPVWISLVPRTNTVARIEELSSIVAEDRSKKLPLYGIPFAVKDNIDVTGLMTTAACPAFAQGLATQSAPIVVKLEQAGAILIGKTNMDQFATGLVGTRTPYGACTSVFNSNYISGGSSSGSAVAVASGLVTFSLGTDTGGSGRVPAMFNNVIGLKPTRGLVSKRGVVPACRTLDCISVFAKTVLDASIVLAVIRGYDEEDPYSRIPPAGSGSSSWSDAATFRFGVPTLATRTFFGDVHNPVLFQRAIDVIMSHLGGEPVEFDLTPFLAVGNLLFKGPWVAERYAAIGHFVEQHGTEMDPMVHTIIAKAKDYTATDAFNAAYELEKLKKKTNVIWNSIDFLLVPTAPRTYTLDEIATAPIERNSHLGYYTNFVNLLDLAAVAVPAGMRPDGLPFGVTLIGQAFMDTTLLLLADRVHRVLATTLGGSTHLLTATPKLLPTAIYGPPGGCFLLAVVGAYLSGQPLNWQLIERNARLVRICRTHPEYRLYMTKSNVPAKLGLVRVPGTKGPGVELEMWALPVETVASFVDSVLPPLTIGQICLDDERLVKGFLMESSAVNNAEDVTDMSGR